MLPLASIAEVRRGYNATVCVNVCVSVYVISHRQLRSGNKGSFKNSHEVCLSVYLSICLPWQHVCFLFLTLFFSTLATVIANSYGIWSHTSQLCKVYFWISLDNLYFDVFGQRVAFLRLMYQNKDKFFIKGSPVAWLRTSLPSPPKTSKRGGLVVLRQGAHSRWVLVCHRTHTHIKGAVDLNIHVFGLVPRSFSPCVLPLIHPVASVIVLALHKFHHWGENKKKNWGANWLYQPHKALSVCFTMDFFS